MTTSVKTCFKCGAEKPLTDFYKHPMMGDGHLNKCKECTKADTKRNRRDKIDYYREYDIQRYRENPERRDKVLAWYRRKTQNSPAMKRAVYMVELAVKRGDIIKRPCEVCGDPKSEAHHCDYLKPFDVMWLCRSHHIQWHHDNGPGLNADAPIENMDTKAA